MKKYRRKLHDILSHETDKIIRTVTAWAVWGFGPSSTGVLCTVHLPVLYRPMVLGQADGQLLVGSAGVKTCMSSFRREVIKIRHC